MCKYETWVKLQWNCWNSKLTLAGKWALNIFPSCRLLAWMKAMVLPHCIACSETRFSLERNRLLYLYSVWSSIDVHVIEMSMGRTGVVHRSKEESQQQRQAGKSGYANKHQKDGVRSLTLLSVSSFNCSSKRPRLLFLVCCRFSVASKLQMRVSQHYPADLLQVCRHLSWPPRHYEARCFKLHPG